MKHGNWIPISKALIRHLPKGRQYTKLEACISVQFDYDCKNQVTVAGYSALWSWSRTRISKFLNDIGVEIIYPEKTQKKQNQKGQIAIQIQDRSETDTRQIRCIKNTYLEEQKDRLKTDEEQIKDRSGSTTIYPKPLNPNPEPKNYSDEIKNFTNNYQQYVLNSFPKTAPKITTSLIQGCCDTIDKLIRLDNFTFKEIYDSIQWASNDDFWSDQILSLSQLRKKAQNGNKKFVNMFTAYKKGIVPVLNVAEKRLKSNLEVSRRFLNDE